MNSHQVPIRQRVEEICPRLGLTVQVTTTDLTKQVHKVIVYTTLGEFFNDLVLMILFYIRIKQKTRVRGKYRKNVTLDL